MIFKGDAVCVIGFDDANKRPSVTQANSENLTISKTVFGVAQDDAADGSVPVLVAGEVAMGKITGLGDGASRIVVTDIANPEAAKRCRLKRIATREAKKPDGFVERRPSPEGFVVGTCNETGDVIIQPRHSSFETGFIKVHNVRAYGAVPDWGPDCLTTDENDSARTPFDNLPAFNAAIQAATDEYQSSASPIKIPVKIEADGWFYLSDTLHIPRGIILEGTGNGDRFQTSGTVLAFPKDVTGIRVHSVYDPDIPAEWLPPTGTVGEQSQIRNLTVYCQHQRGEPPFEGTVAVPPNGHTGHGIHSNITFATRDVTVNNFAENGIFVQAFPPPDAPLPPPSPAEAYGNAAGTHIVNVISSDNGGHGYLFRGGNADTSLIEMCAASGNWGNGFRDEESTGNIYVACYGQGNLGEHVPHYSRPEDPEGYSPEHRRNHDFHVENDRNNASAFFGCYSEQSDDFINYPAMVIGGVMAEGEFAPGCDGFSLSGGVAQGGPLAAQNKRDSDSARVEIGGPTVDLGASDRKPHALTLVSMKAGEELNHLYLVYQPTVRGRFHHWWDFLSEGIGRSIMRLPTINSTIDRDDEAREARHPSPWMTDGLYIGREDIANNPIHMTAAPPPPDLDWPPRFQTGTNVPQEYEVGDIIWNNQPTAGGPIGWICIKGGAPTTANPPTFAVFATSDSPSKVYSTDRLLDLSDQFVTVTASGTTMTLPESPVDGQTHSIKSQTGITTTINAAGGATIDGQPSVTLATGECGVFRYSQATREWERR